MLIIPAIDLIAGGCVRLRQGAFDDVSRYGDPLEHMAEFARAGARLVHIVDLDGARAGRPVQTDVIRRLARSGVAIQCGGGVRTREDVEALLEAGAARVVVGSLAATAPHLTLDWIAEFGAERICCAFDVRGDEVRTHGWTAGAGVALDALLDAFPPSTLRHALVTDIARDGELSGPNVALVERLARSRPDLAVQASGGVAALDDLDRLREAGAAGAVIGRALYEGRFTLEAALGR